MSASVAPPGPEALEGLRLDAEVTALEEDHVLVRLTGEGAGAEGLVPLGDFRVARSDPPQVAVGDRFEVHVEHRAQDGRRFVVSRDKAMRLRAFERVLEAYRAGERVEGEVVGTVEGGFSVDVGVRAFLPASQVGTRPIRRPEEILGQRFTFKIIRLDRSRQNVVVSRRVLIEADREARLARLKVGAIVEGTVKSFTEYGAFVDIGSGVEGLLHLVEMSWSRVRKPQDQVALGDRITVKVIEIDKERRRISLSLRQLQDDPWLTAMERYPEGTVVRGLVVSKTDFGCFIEIETGLEGLIHSTGGLVAAGDAAILRKTDIGDELTARVVDVDLAAKRMSLILHRDDG